MVQLVVEWKPSKTRGSVAPFASVNTVPVRSDATIKT